jgi:hypothetical protein
LRILSKCNPEAVLLALGWTAIGNWWGFMETVGQRHQPE